jgi:hypothetical protein
VLELVSDGTTLGMAATMAETAPLCIFWTSQPEVVEGNLKSLLASDLEGWYESKS